MSKALTPCPPDFSSNALPQRLRERINAVMFDLRLSAQARQYVTHRIETGPSRQVQGRLGNRTYNIHSRKMGMRHKLESHAGEYVLATQLEWDDTVLAYLPQPPQVTLTVKRQDGSNANVTTYTSDMLVVRATEIVIVETRDDFRLLQSSETNPHQFYRDDQGRWHYRAAEEHFDKLGFRYELRPNSSMPARLVENTRFLADYLHEERDEHQSALATAIAQAVAERRFVPLHTLQQLEFKADDVFRALADGLIYVDLERDRLSSSQDLVFYSDKATHHAVQLANAAKLVPALPTPGTYVLKPNSQVRMDGHAYTVIMCGERDVILRDPSGHTFTRGIEELLEARRQGQIEIDEFHPGNGTKSIADVSAVQLASAAKKLDAIKANRTDVHSKRSISRYKGAVEGAVNDLEALLALVDNTAKRGNRTPRITALNLELIQEAISLHYNDERNTNRKGAWDKYVGMCSSAVEPSGQPVQAIAYATFCRYCNDQESIHARKGRRAAYQTAAITQSLDNPFPVHGARPHEICYIDHTVANIALVSPHGNQLGKPTLTLAIDGCTAQTRAMYLSFDPPSAKVVLLVLRDYVRRSGRLPDCLSVDNGKEFHSKELAIFCKLYGVDLRFRAPGMPRGGAMVERLLGATEEEVLSELKGNTRLLKKDTRLVTKSVNPFNHAEWSLPALFNALDDYLFTDRPKRIHPALGVTPEQKEQQRLLETGSRSFKVSVR
jgi:putative transposase